MTSYIYIVILNHSIFLCFAEHGDKKKARI